MDADRPGNLDAGSKQEGRPQDCMLPEYVFPDQMNPGPVPVKVLILAVPPAEGSYVVGERIQPNINRVRRIAWNGDAPLYRHPAYRQVLELARHKGDNLVAASLGLNEVRPRSVKLEQAVLHLGKLEEIALLRDTVQRLLMHWTQWLAGVVVDFLELVAIAAKPAVVFALINVSTVLEYPPKLL